MLVGELAVLGVDVRVRHRGRTGTVVALIDDDGERTMLTDRATATELALVDATWATGLHTLHVPLYSLAVEPLATSSRALIDVARRSDTTVSLDLSSVTVLDELGLDRVLELLSELAPDVVLANEAEAAHLGHDALARLAPPVLVVKQGPMPALVTVRGHATVEVPVPAGDVPTDTTGAGDAFAAGFLSSLASGVSAVEAARRGHQVAAAHLASVGSDQVV